MSDLTNLQKKSLMMTKEVMLRNYFQRTGKQFNTDDITELLFNEGVNNQLYTGVFNFNELPDMRLNALPNSAKSDNRLVNANGLEAKVIGRVTNRGKLIGPFNYFINSFEKPFEVKSWGLSIKRFDGYYFTYSLVDNLKAVIGLMGEEILPYLVVFDDETNKRIHLDLRTAKSFVKKKDPKIFNVSFKGNFKGHSGDYIIDSFSKIDSLKYCISIKQPLLIVNDEIIFKDNAHYQSGSAGKMFMINARPEFYKNIELIKHEVMALLLTKYGHSAIDLEWPKHVPVSDLNYLIDNNDDVISLLTLYEPLERPFLSNGFRNHIFSYINGLIFDLYYIKDWTMAEVDYFVLNNYWDLIISPKLLVDMVEHQSLMTERFKDTCYLNGSVILGDLISNGSSMPFSNPVYSVNPSIISSHVNMPLPSANINVNNSLININAKLTFMPTRHYKLFPCSDNNCSMFNGYYKINHKHKPLPQNNLRLRWDGHYWSH